MGCDFTEITRFIDPLNDATEYGEWTRNPGEMPYITYTDLVEDFKKAFFNFLDEHPEYRQEQSIPMLKKKGYLLDNLTSRVILQMDAEYAIAAIRAIFRVEHFGDGCIEGNLEDGTIQTCLLRLQQIQDRGEPVNL